ncbi:MAG: DUF2752 domain-containing protein [Verrucomicrobiota bacterium]
MGGHVEWRRAGRCRVAFYLVGSLAALGLCRWWMLEHQAYLRALSAGCYFRRLTGCYCPGCGGTRAFFALLRGELGLAWRMNLLLPAGLAAGGLFALLHGVERLSNGKFRRSRHFHMTPAAGWCLGGALVAFWLLRNLPWWPCTLLAPP